MAPRFPLILKSAFGPVFIPLNSILRIDAEDKYSRLHYTNGDSMVLLHSLSDLEERLCCGQRIGDRASCARTAVASWPCTMPKPSKAATRWC